MGSSKCQITQYDPTDRHPTTDRVEQFEGQQHLEAPRNYSEMVIEPETYYSAMEVEDAHHKPKRGSSQRDLKYADYDPAMDGSLSDEVYIVRQNHGYFSIIFSVVQTIVLSIMMMKCGVAPIRMNPMIGPYPDVLSEWGGKNSVLILDDNEWWRLLTPILLHAGVIHLLCNVAVQIETGVFFEKEWGSARWLFIYLSSGVGSTVLSVIVMPNALSVGSSGAIMGLFGAKLSEVVLRACERAKTKQDRVGKQVRKEQCAAVTCSVVVIMLFSFIPYVDWAAHLGGLASGIVVGIFIFACEINSICWRAVLSLAGLALSLVAFFGAFSYMYSGAIVPMEQLKDVCAYYQEALGDDYQCTCQRTG